MLKKILKVKCLKCGKKFNVNCSQNNFDKGNYKHFCCRACANSHVVSEETKMKISKGVKESEIFKKNNLAAVFKRISQNNDAIQENNKIIIYYNCKECGKKYIRNGSSFCCKDCHDVYIKRINSKNGGFKEGSVKNYKSGWYKGIHCDSSWELAFVIYCFDNNYNIERCKDVYKYININGKESEFHPDFIVNGKIYEIKGRQDPNYILKQNCNKEVHFLFKENIQKYLAYVTEKYGKNFCNLYDKKDKIK